MEGFFTQENTFGMHSTNRKKYPFCTDIYKMTKIIKMFWTPLKLVVESFCFSCNFLLRSCFLTSVMSKKVCRPVRSWTVFMATGSFTVSPSGIQMPWGIQRKDILSHSAYLKLKWKVKRNFQIPYGQIQTLHFQAAWSYANLLALRSERELSLSLPKAQNAVMQHSKISQKDLRTLPCMWLIKSLAWGRAQGDFWKTEITYFSTLHVPPHSSLATDGKTAAVQKRQRHHRERHKDESNQSQHYACGGLSVGRHEKF